MALTRYYQVRAVNSIGNSTASDTVSAAVSAGTPSQPSSFTVTTSGRTARLRASVDSRGANITKWQYRRAASENAVSSASWTDFSSSASSSLDKNISQAYSTTTYYQVRAVNSVGNGDGSSIVSATTGASPIPAASAPSISLFPNITKIDQAESQTFSLSIAGGAYDSLSISYRNVTPSAGGNQQTFDLPASSLAHSAFGGQNETLNWNLGSSGKILVNTSLGSGSSDIYLYAISLQKGFNHLNLNLGDARSLNVRKDLSNAFETQGSIEVNANGNNRVFNIGGLDTVEPYVYDVDDISDFINAILSGTTGVQTGNFGATVILRDYVPTSGSINVAGDTRSVVYTAPATTSDIASAGVEVTVTARGTGTRARSGTSDTATVSETFTVTGGNKQLFNCLRLD